MHNLHVSAVKYSLPNLHKSLIPSKCKNASFRFFISSMIEFDNRRVSFVQFSFEIQYFMNDKYGNTELSAVQEEKDLGVFFTPDLKASTQCTKSAAKARRIIGMVRRNFKRLDKNDFLVI